MAKTQSTRSSSKGFDPKGNPGPYVAIVRNHLDSKYMGNLEVEIQFSSGSGNSPNVPGRLAQVSYLSPFYGTTPYEGLTKNEGHQYSQKSYGMWMVPPDPGTKVLVMFAEGNRGQGYWFGCIQEDYMNFMVPGVSPSTTYNDFDLETKYPVGEYNKKVETAKGRDPTQFIKPVFEDAYDVLAEQGLEEDETRGLTSSSARRELPSTVFGISTPGPQDKRPGAPTVQYGENFAQTVTPFNRLGGTSFVMDDGDATMLREGPASESPYVYKNKEKGEDGGDPTIPHNELVRLKTRTGHQILLHNSEDLIYIGNAKGTTWIELTSNGKIDIFAQDSISIHTENDLNITADRDINMHAGRDFNVKANRNVNLESVANWQIVVGGDNKITTTGKTEINSGGNHVETAAQIHMNGPTATKAEPLQTFKLPGETETSEESLHRRLPQHEPWIHHENFDPTKFTTELTDIELTDPIEDPEIEPVPDTFRKNIQRPANSKPATPPPGKEAAEPTKTQQQETGVIKSKSDVTSTTEPPADVTKAIDDVKTDLTPANVSVLDTAVDKAVELGEMGFAAAQSAIQSIDSTYKPTTLKSIVDAGVGIYEEAKVAASDALLQVRTKLAKINTL